MKICFFTKYPPTEGGTASRSYWLARALGERGVEVHIITDALEESIWREKINFEDLEDLENYQPVNVHVHSLDEGLRKPDASKTVFSQTNESRLASLGIGVIERYQCELIDSHYFLKYGTAAFMAKQAVNLPFILRHAGSDLKRIFFDINFHPLFKKIFKEVDLIFTKENKRHFFQEMGACPEKLNFSFSWGVDPKYFNPQVLPADFGKYGLKLVGDTPVITFIGKTGKFKGIYELIEAANQIQEKFCLFFVTGGPEREHFEDYVKKFPNLKDKCFFSGFLPPWEIPAILKSSDCLVQLETGFPVAGHMPIQPLEAMAVGTCPIISEEIYMAYKNMPGMIRGKNILVVNPKDSMGLKNDLEKIIKDKNRREEVGSEAAKIFDQETFSKSIEKTIKIYENLIRNGSTLKSFLEAAKELILKYSK